MTPSKSARSPVVPLLAIVLAILFGSQVVLVEPLVSRAAIAEQSLNAASGRIADAENSYAALGRAEQLASAIKLRLAALLDRSKLGADPLGIQEHVDIVGRKAGAVINRMERVAQRELAVGASTIVESRYSLEAVGSYASLARVVGELSRPPWLARLDRFSLLPDRAAPDIANLSLDFVIITVSSRSDIDTPGGGRTVP